MAQRHVKALKYARNLLKNKYSHYEFICVALDNYHREKCYDTTERCSANQVAEYIGNVLSEQETNNVQSWLMKKGYYHSSMGHKVLRQYRLRWIDHMIENHEQLFGKD